MTLRSTVRCAIYTRVSTEQGLEQDFNSLDAQYDYRHPLEWGKTYPSLSKVAFALSRRPKNQRLCLERVGKYCDPLQCAHSIRGPCVPRGLYL
jgi:hypothetical protein